MVSKNYNVQLVNINSDGTQDNINPITNSGNIRVTPQNNIPSEATDLGKLLNLLGILAFKDTQIDDNQVSTELTWSSSKLTELLTDIDNRLKVLEEYLSQQALITIDESGTMEMPTVCGTINDDTLRLASTITIEDETMNT